jgi:hypothetical protein
MNVHSHANMNVKKNDTGLYVNMQPESVHIWFRNMGIHAWGMYVCTCHTWMYVCTCHTWLNAWGMYVCACHTWQNAVHAILDQMHTRCFCMQSCKGMCAHMLRECMHIYSMNLRTHADWTYIHMIHDMLWESSCGTVCVRTHATWIRHVYCRNVLNTCLMNRHTHILTHTYIHTHEYITARTHAARIYICDPTNTHRYARITGTGQECTWRCLVDTHTHTIHVHKQDAWVQACINTWYMHLRTHAKCVHVHTHAHTRWGCVHTWYRNAGPQTTRAEQNLIQASETKGAPHTDLVCHVLLPNSGLLQGFNGHNIASVLVRCAVYFAIRARPNLLLELIAPYFPASLLDIVEVKLLIVDTGQRTDHL